MPVTPEPGDRGLASSRERSSGVVLAFDLGRKRIGLATANLQTRTATPLRAITVAGALPWPKIDELLAEWRPEQLVVGQPEGSPSTHWLDAIEAFAHALIERYELPVALVNEALTSRAARSELAERRRSGFLRRQVRRGKVDSLAACLIAEQWLAAAGAAPSDSSAP